MFEKSVSRWSKFRHTGVRLYAGDKEELNWSQLKIMGKLKKYPMPHYSNSVITHYMTLNPTAVSNYVHILWSENFTREKNKF